MKKRIPFIVLIVILILAAIGFIFIFLRGSNIETNSKSARKILYYRNPMNPEVKSPVPMKDSMGMDYIPVYEEAPGAEGSTGFNVSTEKQQLIGLSKEKIGKKHLIHQILAVGKIAYDPDLYLAQEEYLQALKTVNKTRNSVLASVTEQSNSLLQAAEKKLLLLGMSKDQITELAKRGSSEENLYLTASADTVWVYIDIYEYEIGLVKEGMSVEISAVAFPGKIYKGKVDSILPVLNPETRSIRVRAEIKDPEHQLKPEMFVNAVINIDLGEKLAIPESAVIDTGIRKVVYLVSGNDKFQQQEVRLGEKALGYYEVLGGLKEGDSVVTSGNFLIDSESKLKGNTND